MKKRNILLHYCAIGALALLFYVLLTESGYANTKPAELTGKWQFKVVRGPDKSFQYCQAQAPFTNHLNLVLAQDMSNTLNLAIKMPQKIENFPPTNMLVKFDTIYNHQTQAYIENDQMMVLPLMQHFNLYKILSKSKTLEVVGPEDVVAFNLKGSLAAVSKLRECVMLQRLPKERPSSSIKKIKPVQATRPQKASQPIVKAREVDSLPISIRSIFDSPRLTARVKIDKQQIDKEIQSYMWEVMGLKIVIKERPIPNIDAEAFINEAVLNHVNKLQSECGPDGISFLGPLHRKASKMAYRSSSFVCDIPKSAWYETIVLFYDPKRSSMFEMSFYGPEKLSKRIDWIKEHTLKSIQQMN